MLFSWAAATPLPSVYGPPSYIIIWNVLVTNEMSFTDMTLKKKKIGLL